MYAQYQYSAGHTAANLLADIGLLLTGTTDKATLSAGVDQANTSIWSTDAAGWSLYDGAAGTNAACYRVAWHDAAQYCYIVIDTNTAGYVLMKGYESWNSGTHTGTNLIYSSDNTTVAQRVNLANGGRLDLLINPYIVGIFSYQSGVYGNSGASSPYFIAQRTRITAYDTIAGALPPFVGLNAPMLLNSYGSWYAPRLKNGNTGASLTAGNAGTYNTSLSAFFSAVGGALPASTILNASAVLVHYLLPIYLSYNSHGFTAKLHDSCRLFCTTGSFGFVYDEVTVGASTYRIWTAGAMRYAVLKG